MGSVHLFVLKDGRYLFASEYSATINGLVGQKRRYKTVFDVPEGKHWVEITGKPEGLAFEKWESRGVGNWQKITIRQPTHMGAYIITGDGTGLLWGHLFKTTADELLQARHDLMDQLTSLIHLDFEEIWAGDLIQMCQDRWNNSERVVLGIPDVKVIIYDKWYDFASLSQTLEVLEANWVDRYPYVPNAYDCGN